MSTKPKILFFDIESSPNLAYVWGMWEQNVIEVDRAWTMLSFAYKWSDGKVQVHSLDEYSTYKKDKFNDRELTKELWKLFNEADIIIAHNGDKFDIKKSNAKFLEHGLPPPSSYKTVDTLKVARKHFALNSNKLNDVARFLGLGEKVKHSGFELWKGCMEGDPAAWVTMRRYNRMDVLLLEQVYNVLRSWMPTHPNLNVIAGTPHNCPICGSDNLHKRGTFYSRTTQRQRYQCNNCRGWSCGEAIKIEQVIR